MFRIITVEREYGAGGSLVAAELARRKGLAAARPAIDLRDRQDRVGGRERGAPPGREVRSAAASAGQGLLARKLRALAAHLATTRFSTPTNWSSMRIR